MRNRSRRTSIKFLDYSFSKYKFNIVFTAYRFHELSEAAWKGGLVFLGSESDLPVFMEGLATLENPIAEAAELMGPIESKDNTLSLFQLSRTINIHGK